MTTVTAAVLEPVGEANIALESVDIQASLQGLMSEVIVTQTYRNEESRNIEAVYTFPLPLDAVLLDLSLELNGKTLQGLVTPRATAEKRYEDAIEEGDSAILLQKLKPGVFTINVGNILPGERAVVRFRYAQLHRWQGDSLRFHLPTTIAPRYGDPSAAGLAAHEIPEYALSADRGFSLTIQVEGELASANLDFPTHPVAVSISDDLRKISLSGGSALMDRDFVMVVNAPAQASIEGLWAADQEEYIALASFHPTFPEGVPDLPRCVKLVVDCSGSMGGDSIAQAKAALSEILSLLKPDDYFNLVAFGSGYDLLFPEPVVANAGNIRTASQFVEQMDANMGGTEIGTALDAAYRCGKAGRLSSDLLLITDGAVWREDGVLAEAKKSGHRIFSVGVGSAVSEAFVREIAETTGGACELVSPRENMADRIVRHFRRIDQPGARSVQIEWPEAPLRQIPAEPDAVYAGDTLHVFGWFKNPPVGKVNLKLTLEDGRTISEEVLLPTEFRGDGNLLAGLPRVGADERIQTLAADEAAELAERYQLVTQYTSCVLVYDREDSQKAEAIPALRKVPQVMAAGWGGLGSVTRSLEFRRSLGVREVESLEKACFSPSNLRKRAVDRKFSSKSLSDGFPDFLGSPSPLPLPLPFEQEACNGFDLLINALNDRYPDSTAARLDIAKVDDLLALGLDQQTADQLLDLVADGCEETGVVFCFLEQLSGSSAGEALSRHVRRLIHKASKRSIVTTEVVEGVSRLISEGY